MPHQGLLRSKKTRLTLKIPDQFPLCAWQLSHHSNTNPIVWAGAASWHSTSKQWTKPVHWPTLLVIACGCTGTGGWQCAECTWISSSICICKVFITNLCVTV
jgi:hypothetical protein